METTSLLEIYFRHGLKTKRSKNALIEEPVNRYYLLIKYTTRKAYTI